MSQTTYPATEQTERGNLIVDLGAHGRRVLPASRHAESPTVAVAAEISESDYCGRQRVQVQVAWVEYADGTHSTYLGNCWGLDDLERA